MTNPPTHYLNFVPVEAVQCGDMTWQERDGRFGWVPANHPARSPEPNDWLLKHLDGTVTVQDQEPPRVERWEWANSRHDGRPVGSVCSEYDAREFHDADPEKYLLWRRPVLNNGRTGDWEEVTP